MTKAVNRYKDIFVAIDQKDRNIQNSYKKLQSGYRNLALAETERDRSIEELLSKQQVATKKTIDEYEIQAQNRRVNQLSNFKKFNEFNLNIKRQKNLNNTVNQK